MKKLWMIGAALAALAACNDAIPASNGPGFSDPIEWERAQREAALTGAEVSTQPLVPPGADPLAAPATSTTTATATGTPRAGTIVSTGITPESSSDGQAIYIRSGGVEASPSNAAPVLYNHPGLSDEQDFQAVSSRETIESDAERRAALAAQYEVVQPTALPTRTSTGPNIVEYALSAPNQLGQEWYSRFILSGEGRYRRNCAKYTSADEAQRDFLARGGPDRDPRGIDPDGDGFACSWDPAPYIAAARSTASGN